MKKNPRKSLSIPQEIIKQIQILGETLKQNINDQNFTNSLFNKPENADLIKIILKKKLKTEIETFIIKMYLKSLNNFMSVINESKDEDIDIDILLNRMSQDLKCEYYSKNSILMKIGEIGKTFYVILSGSVDILVPKESEVYMTKIEYIDYLKLLNLYNENYLLEKTIAKNSEIFQIKNEDIEISEHNNINETIDMNLKNYLFMINAVKFQEFNKLKVKLKILSYYKVLSLGIGSSFGDYALINENSMRTATIFVKEDSFFGTLSKQSYQNSIKSVNEKSNKLSLNFVFNTTIFDEITFPYFTIRYWNFFIKNRIKRDELLFENKSHLEDIIFFYEGEVTLIIPHLTCKKIDELISKIGNTSIEYNQYNDVEKPKDIALKHIKKGDILGMNDIVIDNEFICNAVCKSEQAIYFSINIKIFNYILNHYKLVKKTWQKFENTYIHFVIDRLKIIKNTLKNGMIKRIREDYKKIEIDKICPNDNETTHEKNLFNCIKKNFEIETKGIKKFKKRGSQIYIQKINLNNSITVNQKRNSVVLPKIISELDLNKNDFVKNNFYNKNLYSSSSSPSSSHSSFQSSSSSKRMKTTLPNYNQDPAYNKYLTNVNNTKKLKSKSGHINIKIVNPNHIKNISNISLIGKKEINFKKSNNQSLTDTTKTNSKKFKIKIPSKSLQIHNSTNTNTNIHEFKVVFKPKKLPKIVNKRNKKISLISDYETTEFAKRITFNDPISNILVNKQNQNLRKIYVESNLYKTLNKRNKSYNKKRVNYNQKNKIKLLLPNHNVNHIPINFWTNGKNKGVKSFINQVFG